MNSPEWITILIGCIACLLNGAAQPLFAVLFAKIVNVTNMFYTVILQKDRFYAFFMLLYLSFRPSKIVYTLNDVVKCYYPVCCSCFWVLLFSFSDAFK
jgi:hypothetical protein